MHHISRGSAFALIVTLAGATVLSSCDNSLMSAPKSTVPVDESSGVE